MNLPEFKLPWVSVDKRFASGAESELRREVGRNHVLKGRLVRCVAWRQGCDDVLFLLEDELPRCAEVHLTRSGKEEPVAEVPATTFYESLSDWVAKSMIPDHEESLADDPKE